MTTYTKTAPYLATLSQRECLSKAGSSKATYHVTIDIEPGALCFAPGDSVAVLPTNPIEDIERILALIPETTITHPKTGEELAFSTFIEGHANLNRITSPLLRALNAEHLDRNAHDVVTLIENAGIENTGPLDAQILANALPPLLPRFYSIASNRNDAIELLISTFRYKKGEREKTGVGSDFLCHRAEIGQQIPLYVSPSEKFKLPEEATPIIMIGPGTGVAPYRAFLQARENHSGANWLFFGERNAATDFYYEEYFQDLSDRGKLHLTTAFSRDQEEKIYVQHKLLDESKKVYEWLQNGAVVYVCGDARFMAKDVNSALLTIIEKESGCSPEEAQQFIKELRKNKRYLLDVY